MNESYDYDVRKNYGGFFLNCLTIIILVAALAAAGVYAVLFINPQIPFNPYPPPTLPPTLGPPTGTPTPEIFLPETWTPTATRTATPTETPLPTSTPSPSPPPASATPEFTPTGPPFSLQPGAPVLTPNIANDLECDWMGVGGQVFDLSGEPISDLGIHLEGEVGELQIDLDALSGSAPELGPAGYVFNVADSPIASDGTLWIQVNDTAGVPLSDQVFLETTDSCDENFVLVNWNQVR
jgi:hypothetical protein